MQTNNTTDQTKFSMYVNGPSRTRDRPERRWMKVVKIDLNKCNLPEDFVGFISLYFG